MKIIRKKSKGIATMLIFSLLVASCSHKEDLRSFDSVSNSQVANSIDAYTGVDLFKGIFFSEGNVASKFENYQKFEKLKTQFSQEEKIAFLKLQDDVIKKINDVNPNYFSKFEKSMQSGNHIIIRNELQNSKQILKNAIQEITSIDYAEIEKSIYQEKTKLVVDLDNIQNLKSKILTNGSTSNEVVQERALVVIVVGVIAIAAVGVAVYLDIVYWSDGQEPAGRIMNDEDFINSIARLYDVD